MPGLAPAGALSPSTSSFLFLVLLAGVARRQLTFLCFAKEK